MREHNSISLIMRVPFARAFPTRREHPRVPADGAASSGPVFEASILDAAPFVYITRPHFEQVLRRPAPPVGPRGRRDQSHSTSAIFPAYQIAPANFHLQG